MYIINTYNGVYQLEFRGCFETFDEAMEVFEKYQNEYMENFDYEVGSTEYNQELENFIFNSQIYKK